MVKINHRSSKNQWETPKWLFDELNKEFNFVIDLCAEENNKKCKKYLEDIFTESSIYHISCIHSLNDGSNPCAFMNPPFSDIYPFIERALFVRKYLSVVILVKDILSTKAFSLIYDYDKQKPKDGVEIRYFPKRINYELNGKEIKGCSFASMLIILKRLK